MNSCWSLFINGNAEVGVSGISYTWAINDGVGAWARVGEFGIDCPSGLAPYTYSLVAWPWSDDNASFTISWNSLITNFASNYANKNAYFTRIKILASDWTFLERPFFVIVNPPSSGNDVVNMAIKTQPDWISYTIWDKLDLSGLVVTLVKSNWNTEDVTWNNFATKWITTSLQNGTILNETNKSFIIVANWLSKEQKIFVDPVWSSIIKNNNNALNKDNLVIITHGVCGSAYDRWANKTWLRTMRNSIYKKGDSENTVVRLYDWEKEADSLTCPLNSNPLAAYGHAAEEGGYLAQQIEQQIELRNPNLPPIHIHFIAHSAGSNVIQKAVDGLSKYYHNKGVSPDEAPFIHITFLDAYVPNQGDIKSFGDLSGGQLGGYSLFWYSELYLNMGDLPDTDNKLGNSVNYDITSLRPDWINGHEWPIWFYINSINDWYQLWFLYAKENLNYMERWANSKGYVCSVSNVVNQPYNCYKSTFSNTIEQISLDENTWDYFNAIVSSNDLKIDVSNFVENNKGLPQMNLYNYVNWNENVVWISINKWTNIISDDPNWDWSINIPKQTLLKDGWWPWANVNAIEIWYSKDKLSFDKAVRLIFWGKAGKNVRYSRNGTSSTEITRICSTDSQAYGNSLPNDSECKMNVWNDLVVWTKHFTIFATYDEVSPSNNGWWGGGGGIYVSTPIRPIASTGSTTLTTSGVTISIPTSLVIKAKDIKRSIYRDAISTLISKGVIANNPLIYPNRFISRAEFIKILAKANGFTPTKSAKQFADVDSKSELAQYIYFGVEKGWINPENENFRPDARITQGEVDKLITTVKSTATATKKIGASRFVTRGKAMKDIVDAFFGK